jgi:hypothetical protein
MTAGVKVGWRVQQCNGSCIVMSSRDFGARALITVCTCACLQEITVCA